MSGCLLLALCLFGGAELAWSRCTDAGRHGSQCPPWSSCSVYLGDCYNGMRPLAVCTGHCRPGGTPRIIIKSGGLAASRLDRTFGGVFGVELVPPGAWIIYPEWSGFFSLHAEWWTQDVWRFGPAYSHAVHSSLVLAVTADVAHAESSWGAGISGRVEFFPWILLRGLIPLQYVSMALSSGVLFLDAEDLRPAFLSLSLRVWI